jgi:predicted nucleic acid-binding protein
LLVGNMKDTISFTPAAKKTAEILVETGIDPADAAHLASAMAGGCDVFLTTDDDLLSKARRKARERLHGIKVMNPVEFIMEVIKNERNV